MASRPRFLWVAIFYHFLSTLASSEPGIVAFHRNVKPTFHWSSRSANNNNTPSKAPAAAATTTCTTCCRTCGRTTRTFCSNNNKNDSMLQSRYFDRLGFSQEQAESASSIRNKKNLDTIIEAHLAHMTFDNLSQHGLPFRACLDVEATARKLLDRKRGGFCFELNGLLGELLEELGYSVKRVPAIVYAPPVGFRSNMATHLILIVSVNNNDNNNGNESELDEWLVDVGFGEPAINSLRYELDTEQETPEGMVSRIVQCPEDPNRAILEWRKEDNDHKTSDWSPRLQWEFRHPGQDLSQFQSGLDVVLGDSSIFHQKLIVCQIDRREKLTLAGTRLKRTSPRFGPESVTEVVELEPTVEAIQQTLREKFGVLHPTDGLDLTRTLEAQPDVWSQL